MKKVSVAGVGALAFAILVFVASMIDNGPGGTYSASDVADYLKSGHRPIVFVAWYMSMLGIVGLLFLLSRLRDAIGDDRRARSSGRSRSEVPARSSRAGPSTPRHRSRSATAAT